MKTLARSFQYAFDGFASAIQSETNWKIGLVEALLVILASVFFQISRNDWIIVIMLIGMILSAELFNSAIEKLVNSFSPGQHPGAKLAKDFSAGAVVIIIVSSAVVGTVLFLPYLEQWLVRIGI